ncbi:helix-turn-helix domain-containing protein [Nocardia sp. NPDC049707]|uniref:helix-turn-helix domain-containing protein n=1 Tax=Nocardia sp. NPDC049707 TaxID=3154735 RepID=UPI0034380E4D
MSVQATRWAARKVLIEDGTLKCLLMIMADAAGSRGEGVWLSQETLALRTGFTDRTIRRSLEKLKDLGLIRPGNPELVAHLPKDERPLVWNLVLSRTIGQGEVPRTPRKLTRKTATGPDTESTKDRTLSPEGPDTESKTPGLSVLQSVNEALVEGCGDSKARQSPLLSVVPEPVEAATEAADPFEDFWDVYPKHAKRDEARTEWDDAIAKGADAQAVIDAARRYADDPETRRLMNSPTERRFIPFARSWLKDRAWKDWGTQLRAVSGDNYGTPAARPFNPNWQEI